MELILPFREKEEKHDQFLLRDKKQMAPILMFFFFSLIQPKPLNSNAVLCVLVTLLFFPSGGFPHNVGLCCVAPEKDNSITVFTLP